MIIRIFLISIVVISASLASSKNNLCLISINSILGTSKSNFDSFLKKQKLSDEELVIIKNYLTQEEGKSIDYKKLEDFVSFSSTFYKRKLALNALSELNNPQSNNKYIKKYAVFNNKMNRYSKRKKKQFLSKERKKALITNDAAIISKSEHDADTITTAYRKRTLDCRSKHQNDFKKTGNKAYMKFATAIGVSAGVLGFLSGHKDEVKDGKWFGKLSYDVAMSIIYSYIGAYFVTSTKGNMGKVILHRYFVEIGMTVGDTRIYEYFFGVAPEDVKKRLKELLANSKDEQEDMRILIAYLDHEHVAQKVKRQMIDKLKSIFYDKDQINKLNLTNIPAGNIDKDEFYDELLHAMYIKMYEEQSGELLKIGTKGDDRLTYFAMFGIPIFTYMTLAESGISRFICMGQAKPLQTTAIALFIYAVQSYFYFQVEYPIRYKFIAQ